jgi:hypothetical protein
VQGLTNQASLPEKFTSTQHCNDTFLALLGYDCDLDLALLDEEDRVGRVPLQEDRLPRFEVLDDASSPNRREERFDVELRWSLSL